MSKPSKQVVRTIRQQEAIWVSYQSMTSLDESVRLLSPHALGNDGFRWHMRAFCHKRQRFSDFVLARSCALMASKRAKWTPARIRIGILC